MVVAVVLVLLVVGVRVVLVNNLALAVMDWHTQLTEHPHTMLVEAEEHKVVVLGTATAVQVEAAVEMLKRAAATPVVAETPITVVQVSL
jgi:hypothetical protein